MRCAWSVVADEPESVLFQCNASGCGREIRFVKEAFGTPNPVRVGETWAPPENVADWMDACPPAPEE